ncbi:MAG: dephospho-CoA kinase [Rubrimonas sp.]|uniref:dephospho-CoA kinase n=1 Tax=Rubrimonas sp. TaxID=2036015 RepID=UPI002FDDDA5F
MIALGLTGSIGMGKSTTARMFAAEGARVWDADEAVRRLYARGGPAVPAVSALAPGAIRDGAVDRDALRAAILADPALLPRIEAAVHPLVEQDRSAFLVAARADEAEMALCDIPLLFETGAQTAFDAVVVASAPPEVQRARVLAREGMTPAAFAAILARQTPDAEKRARADFVIDTGAGFETARAQVRDVVAELRGGWKRSTEAG